MAHVPYTRGVGCILLPTITGFSEAETANGSVFVADAGGSRIVFLIPVKVS